MAPAPSLTFKGPANAKRTSKPVVRLDPVVPRNRPASTSASTSTKQRRLSTDRDDDDAPRSPAKAARRARATEVDDEEDEIEMPVKKKKQKGNGAEGKGDKKAPTKPSKAVERDDEGSSSAPSVAHEERVSRETVDKRWKALSPSTFARLQERAKNVIDDSLRLVLRDSATDESVRASRKMINDFTDETEAALAAVVVPPLPSSLPQALKGKGKAKDDKVDLTKVLNEDDLRDQLTTMQNKLDAAEEDAEELEKELEKERRLLKRDKARLAKSG
ncbi:hypothetical protein JCM9279_000437 [Rhodotorula babjevae]